MRVETSEIQGIVMGSYAGYPCVRHLIFSSGEAEALRGFVEALLPLIVFGTAQPPVERGWIANLSLAAPALKALLPPEIYARLESAYREGPDAERIGDVGASAPAHWWEKQFQTIAATCFVHLHGTSAEQIALGTARVLEEAGRHGIAELIAKRSGERLDACFMGRGPAGVGARIHFGYVDGLSKSGIAWSDPPSAEAPVNFRSVVIGYNEDSFPSAPATGPAAAMFRDSSYVAFRWVYQDVAAFERFLAENGPRLFPHSDPGHAREMLAAKMMGRWRDGTPLIVSPDAPAPERALEDFGYANDPSGAVCPASSHIRVMNPRDQPLFGAAATTGVPQIIRRGMSYGPPLASTEDDGIDRGILGMFICASLREQFMRLAAWGTRNNFSRVFPAHGRDQDAVVGNRSVPGATRTFRIPGAAGGGTCANLGDFIRTKGTQYLMLPSRTTFQRLLGRDAEAGAEQPRPSIPA